MMNVWDFWYKKPFPHLPVFSWEFLIFLYIIHVDGMSAK